MKLSRVLVALSLFGVTFGYVEAAVVVYLRAIERPIRQQAFPEQRADEIFPFLQAQHWQVMGRDPTKIAQTEFARELATLAMLAAVAVAHARNRREWLAGFMIAFGIWDIFYYVFLRLLLGWPGSLMTWDILFLVPVPWVGPVITPVLVSLAMIGWGVVILWRESLGRPIRLGWTQRGLVLAGSVIVIAAFCWDFRNVAAGGWPGQFNWPLFALGGAVGMVGVLRSLRTGPDQQRPALAG